MGELRIEEGERSGRVGDAASDQQFSKYLRQVRGLGQIGRGFRMLLGKKPTLLGTTQGRPARPAHLSCIYAGRAHRAYTSSS